MSLINDDTLLYITYKPTDFTEVEIKEYTSLPPNEIIDMIICNAIDRKYIILYEWFKNSFQCYLDENELLILQDKSDDYELYTVDGTPNQHIIRYVPKDLAFEGYGYSIFIYYGLITKKPIGYWKNIGQKHSRTETIPNK
jgi:hypothetical protein